MKWTVSGADRETGEDRIIVVEAPNQDDAEESARFKGVIVSSVGPATTPPRAPIPSQTVSYSAGSFVAKHSKMIGVGVLAAIAISFLIRVAATQTREWLDESSLKEVLSRNPTTPPDSVKDNLNAEYEGKGRVRVILFGFKVESRGAYHDGITIKEVADGDHTFSVNGRKYEVYAIDAEMRSSQTPQASSMTLGESAPTVTGDISFSSWDTDGTTFIKIYAKDAEFN